MAYGGREQIVSTLKQGKDKAMGAAKPCFDARLVQALKHVWVSDRENARGEDGSLHR